MVHSASEISGSTSFSKEGAARQGVEADEAWSTSELRSLTPVFDRPFVAGRQATLLTEAATDSATDADHPRAHTATNDCYGALPRSSANEGGSRMVATDAGYGC